jgi:small subunit ribosomal protein S20
VAKRTASAKKQARAGVRRAARNRAVKSEVKTLVVKARRSLVESAGKDSDRHAMTLDAVRALDRAAAKGILHPNNAARRKGRLARQLAKAAVAAPVAAKAKKAPPVAPSRGGAAAARSRAGAASGTAAAPAKAKATKPAAGAAPAKPVAAKKK